VIILKVMTSDNELNPHAQSVNNRPFRMMTVGSDAKLSVCSDFNLNRQLSVDSDEDDEEEDGDEEEVVPVAPDGGWGWVVVLAGFVVHFLLDGINYTFGIMLPPMYGKCYCNMIFSPRPVYMDFTSPLSATEAFSDDQTSIEADNFLASLSSKRRADTEDEDLASHKRAKA